jgi:meiotic recombination protein SPO11
MSRKKTAKEDKTVQATLVEEDGEKARKSKSSKGGRSKVTAKKTPPKKTPSEKEGTKKAGSKKTTKAKDDGKKASPKKAAAKNVSKKTKKSKRRRKKAAPKISKDTIIELTSIPGVGGKLAERLAIAGYDSIERIARARHTSISKKVEGVSADGAKKLVAAAKDAIMMAGAPAEEEEEEVPAEAGEETVKLTDVPGVGEKLAISLTRAGYDSVGRLSRARPDSMAKNVDGISAATAEKIVAAARDIMRAKEAERITAEPETITVAAKATKAEPREESKAEAEEPKAKTAKKKAEKPKKKPARAETRAKPLPPPKKMKPKVIRKDSGLPVPKAVAKIAKEMKEQWAEAEAAAKQRKESGEEDAQLETVEVVNLSSDDTSDRLVEVAVEVLNETMLTGRPAFEIPSRGGDNIVWDEIRDLLLLGMRTISRPYHSLASVVDATRTARVMEIVFELLNSSLHATKREVFYSDVNLFRDQKYSDKIIEDVASMLQTTRDSIHVVASARGSAMGRVVIRDGGDLIDLTKMGTGGWAVTPFLDQLEIVESDAEFIILSEKDAAVMRLAEAKYWNRQPCIVLTGKGSGDIATRAFLKMLVKELEIPAFALVDSDPYGHYIYSVFLRGSKRLSYESPFIATPELKLLGVLSRDLDKYKIPKSVRIPMQPTDIKRVRDMLKEPFVRRNKPWVEDLQLMLRMKEKAEIQSFASHSFEYLTDEYLPTKLETGDWI